MLINILIWFCWLLNWKPYFLSIIHCWHLKYYSHSCHIQHTFSIFSELLISLHTHIYFLLHSCNNWKLSCFILSIALFTQSLWLAIISDNGFAVESSLLSSRLVGSVWHNWHIPTDVFSKAVFNEMAADSLSTWLWWRTVLQKKRMSVT